MEHNKPSPAERSYYHHKVIPNNPTAFALHLLNGDESRFCSTLKFYGSRPKLDSLRADASSSQPAVALAPAHSASYFFTILRSGGVVVKVLLTPLIDKHRPHQPAPPQRVRFSVNFKTKSKQQAVIGLVGVEAVIKKMYHTLCPFRTYVRLFAWSLKKN